ncbi:MAG: hypothetical protein ACK6AD_16350 [Cyanobacteriota bacterium]
MTTGGHARIDSPINLAQSQIPSISTPLIIFFGGAGDSSVSETVKTLASALQKRYRSSGSGSEKVLIKYFPWDGEAASTNAIRVHLRVFPNSSIILVGHSYGGDTAFKVADKLEKDKRVKLLVTLDPVGHYYGINNNLDCRPDYPSDTGRKSEEERQCELQRRQRKKPASTDKWINVWAKGASTFGDLVSSAGGRWNRQANADQDIPMNLAHAEASKMYFKTESLVQEALGLYTDKAIGGVGGELLIVKVDARYLKSMDFNHGNNHASHDKGAIIKRFQVRALQDLPDGNYNLGFVANWSIHKDNERLHRISISKFGGSFIGLHQSRICFTGEVRQNSFIIHHVHDMWPNIYGENGKFIPPSSAIARDPFRNELAGNGHLNINLEYPMGYRDQSQGWRGMNGSKNLFLAIQFIPAINPSGLCEDYYRWMKTQIQP